MITAQNWQVSFYRNDHQGALAFISCGAEPSTSGEIKELFFVTMTNFDRDQEFFQQTFDNLEKAVNGINQKYSHWNFVDPSTPNLSGCGSCEAH
ncbi:MAG: hypothetical protein Fur0010_21390 [Bdellovibrio sp.]